MTAAILPVYFNSKLIFFLLIGKYFIALIDFFAKNSFFLIIRVENGPNILR